MDIVTFMGFAGMLLILLAFVLEQIHRWSSDSLLYDGFNFLGSLLLCLYAYFLRSYPFLILNLVWCFVSLRDLVGDLRRSE